MEVFPKYFRRLLQQNANYIFNDGTIPPGSYDILRMDVEKLRVDPEQAPKIAESIDTNDGDTFRNFDVSKFMEHFKLDPVAKSMLALSLKNSSKTDLRTKGMSMRFAELD
jgi:CCR4-NOT transcription complex subunit 1